MDFRGIIDNRDSEFIYYVYDRDGTFTLVSPSLARITGYTARELLGINILDLLTTYPGNDCVLAKVGIVGPLEDWGVKEVELKAKDESLLRLEMEESPVLDGNGEFSGAQAVGRDVTSFQDRRCLTRRVSDQANKAKADFLATLSHEIRNPMNVIAGMTDLALGTELSEQQRGYLETVRNSAHHVLALVGDILDYSRIESDKLVLNNKDFDLYGLIRSIMEAMKVQIWNKDLNLKHAIAEDVPRFVRGDARRLRQVLLNLVGNAVKFTEKGEILVTVDHESCLEPSDDGSEDNVILCFAVRDTGIGIPRDHQETIFDRYEQVESGGKGAGLGLAICNKLVQLMGGSMQVESIPGRGSTFTFRVRLGIGHAEQTAMDEVSIRLKGDKPVDRPLKILLAEDFQANQQLVAALLEKRGHSVRCVGDGQEALDALERESFDLVFMDIQMPVMDGLEATARIRASNNARVSRTPIVALTADEVKCGREVCLGAGMNEYLTKPILARELFRVLAEYEQAPPPSPAESGVFQGPDKAIMDLDHALAMMDGEQDVLIVTLLAIMGNFPIRMVEIREALDSGDTETVSRLAHAMKSATRNIGAPGVAECAYAMEYAGKENNIKGLREIYPRFEECVTILVDEIERYIQAR